MIEVRFHGRGGQGVKIASRILGRSGFLAGLYSQDFALFGAERRGAPVVSFTRLDRQCIDVRGYIERPTLIVLMDDSLLKEAPDPIFHGARADTPLIVNGDATNCSIPPRYIAAADIAFLDLNAICRRVMERAFISAAAAAVAAKSIRTIPVEILLQAARTEFAEFGMAQDLVEENDAAARAVFAVAPELDLHDRNEREEHETPLEPIAGLDTLPLTKPAIVRPSTAALRHTGNWRMQRPVIELEKCKRCFLCYLYCSEAAVQLDAQNYPHIDYDYCKGCLTCCAECPTRAIARAVEA